MTLKLGHIRLWTPRILGILFTAVISLFALDVFDEGNSPVDTILALLIHLIPTCLLIISLVIAWKREMVGGLIFMGLALVLLITSSGRSWVIAVPLMLVGLLFIINGFLSIESETND